MAKIQFFFIQKHPIFMVWFGIQIYNKFDKIN